MSSVSQSSFGSMCEWCWHASHLDGFLAGRGLQFCVFLWYGLSWTIFQLGPCSGRVQ